MPEQTTTAAPELAPVDIAKDIAKGGRMLLRIRIQRPVMSNETMVEMQSDFDFASLFAEEENSKPTKREYQLGGVQCVMSRRFSLPSGRGIEFNSGAFHGQPGHNINFGFFMAKNLSTGVRFKFTGRPMSREAAQGWALDMKEFAKEVLSAYMRPVDEGYEVITKPINL